MEEDPKKKKKKELSPAEEKLKKELAEAHPEVSITKVDFTRIPWVKIEGKVKKKYWKEFTKPEEPIVVEGRKKELEKLKKQFTEEKEKRRKKVVPKKVEEVREKFIENLTRTLKELREGKIEEYQALELITKYASEWITVEFPDEFISIQPIIERKEGVFRLTLEVSPKAIANYVDDTVPVSAPLSTPEKIVPALIEVRHLMNKKVTTYPEITTKLDHIRPIATAKKKLQTGEYTPDDFLFTAEEMKTIRRISPTFFSRILPAFTAINRALWAAQLVKNCEEDITGVCKYIESAIEAGPGVEIPEFNYNVLQPAWELHLEGKFNASEFVKEHISPPSAKPKKKPPKIPWRIENFPKGWEIASPNIIENKAIPAKIEVRRTDGRLEVVTIVKGETYDTEIVSTEGGAEVHAQTMAKEIETYYSSSSSEQKSKAEEKSSEEKVEVPVETKESSEEKILEEVSKEKSKEKSTLAEIRKEFKLKLKMLEKERMS